MKSKPVLDLVTEQGLRPVQAFVRAADLVAVRSFEAEWQPLLRQGGGLDAEWPWSQELSELQAADGRAPEPDQQWEIQQLVDVDGVVHGLVSIKHPVVSRLSPGHWLVYVERLSVAPWNRAEAKPNRRVLGCGLALLLHAVSRSLELGHEGRLGLHSLEDSNTHRFYQRLGLVSLGEDLLEEGMLRYYELDESGAVALLSRMGI